MICARCNTVEAEVPVADSTDAAAMLCFPCAAGWVRQVVGHHAASLRVYVGHATAKERAAHERKVIAAQAAEAERERVAEVKRQQTRDRLAQREREREATAASLTEDRARSAAQYVAERGGRVSLPDLARGLMLSRRTLSRCLPFAVERRWLTVKLGVGGGVEAGPVTVPA